MDRSGFPIPGESNTHIYFVVIAVVSFFVILIFNWFFVYSPVSQIKNTVDTTSNTINNVVSRTNILEDKIDAAKDAAEAEYRKVLCAACVAPFIGPALVKAGLCNECTPTQ